LSDAGEYGFYSGLSGIAWSCIQAGAALRCEALVERVLTAIQQLIGLPANRHQPTTAREQFGRPGDIGHHAVRRPAPAAGGRIDQARQLGVGHVKAGVDHAQGFEQACLQELVERLAGGDLDDAREHVDGNTVIPHLAWLMRKRQPRKAGDEIGEGLVATVHTGRAVETVVQPAHHRVIDTIDEAGGVAQQVLDRHRALLRLERELPRSAGRIGGLDADHHIPEFGQILMNRRGEIELALLDQHHRGDAGDRLGHRGDPEDRIGL